MALFSEDWRLMLLILTNSIDGTTDEIVRRVGSNRVFRFNIDLWRDYEFEFSPQGFWLSDPTGRSLQSREIRVAYLRKPSFDDSIAIPKGGCTEAWLRAQLQYVIQEIYNYCRDAGFVRLVEKGAQQRFGKFSQMRLASEYFVVPDWRFVKRAIPPTFTKPTITKALVADFVEDYQFLFTKQVESGALDPAYPWLLQDEVEADADLTVVYVKGQSFAFVLDRSSFDGVDWRKHINKKELYWRRYQISHDLDRSIRAFMEGARLDFGRLDFLLKDQTAYFLEVNPNGQWAWLDVDGSEGIFAAVVNELTRDWTEQGTAPDGNSAALHCRR